MKIIVADEITKSTLRLANGYDVNNVINYYLKCLKY